MTIHEEITSGADAMQISPSIWARLLLLFTERHTSKLSIHATAIKINSKIFNSQQFSEIINIFTKNEYIWSSITIVLKNKKNIR